MDLVNTYSSDESETEHQESVNANNLRAVITSNCSPKTNQKCNSYETDYEKQTEFHCLSDGNLENDTQLKLVKTDLTQSNDRSPAFNGDFEKVDYLHLESSDTEDEEQDSQTKVEHLLNSASILNDKECGPIHQPSEQSEMPKLAPTHHNYKRRKEYNCFEDETLTHRPEIHLKSNIEADLPSKDAPFHIPKLTHIHCNNKRRKENKCNKDETLTHGLEKRFQSNMEADLDTLFPKDSIYREDDRVMTMFGRKSFCRIPKKVTQAYSAHKNIINSISWCVSQYSHLLLSASADCCLKIWDMFSKSPVQCIRCSSGLKAAKWMHQGNHVATGGYGKTAHVFDVLTGKELVHYDVDNYLMSLEIHPQIEDVILCGTKNAILGFDLRVSSSEPIKTFTSKCDEVLDIAFLGESEFVCSTNIVSQDSADRTIMVWDFASGALFSNQIFLERYTCPSLKVHPNSSSFVAQTNGDYIAFFSASKPYKIKNKRCMGHKVSGFGIECDISFDGKYIASGDANGDIYFYDFYTANLVHKLTSKSEMAINRLRWHPVLFSTMATATWDGSIEIWQ